MGVSGLVHDLDWERFPEEALPQTEPSLRRRGGLPLHRAVMSHGWQICTDREPGVLPGEDPVRGRELVAS